VLIYKKAYMIRWDSQDTLVLAEDFKGALAVWRRAMAEFDMRAMSPTTEAVSFEAILQEWEETDPEQVIALDLDDPVIWDGHLGQGPVDALAEELDALDAQLDADRANTTMPAAEKANG
jgi:hypothetical protein